MSELVKTLAVEFSEKDYAHAYMVENSNMRIAAQVRAIRLQRGWSQERLAEISGMAQERISKIESANFNSLTLKTLRALARAFDIHFLPTFVPFSAAIVDFAALSPKWLECDSRESDLRDFLDCLDGITYKKIAGAAAEVVDSQGSKNVVFHSDQARSWFGISQLGGKSWGDGDEISFLTEFPDRDSNFDFKVNVLGVNDE